MTFSIWSGWKTNPFRRQNSLDQHPASYAARTSSTPTGHNASPAPAA